MLIRIAREALSRLSQAPSDLEWGQEDAAVAIVFSAAAIESLVAEFALLCNLARRTSGATPYVGLIADALDELEKQRGSVRLKLLVLKGMLQGEPYDASRRPFQDIALLIDLRDSLVHLKPVETSDGSHKLLRAVVARGLAETPPARVAVPWLVQLLTRACAQWAVRVVEDFAEHIRMDAVKTPLAPSFPLLVTEMWGPRAVSESPTLPPKTR
jgi:hypothetical protein